MATMSFRRTRSLLVAGIIERHDNDILIALPKEDEDRRIWQFPRGPAKPGETPEAAMRRITRDDLGLHIEIVVGQPPLIERIDAVEVELRYFFCGIAKGRAQPGPNAEIRWVPKHHLREYELDKPSRPVAKWLLQSR